MLLFKMKWMTYVVLSLIILLSSACQKSIDTLSKECQFGNKESCLKLVEIAKIGKSNEIRTNAVQKLSDQTMLAEIAKGAYEPDKLCYIALNNPKLVDQMILTDIASTANEEGVRKKAIQKINDLETLTSVALENQNESVRYEAVEKLTNRDVLNQVAFEDPVKKIRDLAIEKLHNPQLENCSDCRFVKINDLKDSDPRLKKIAGSLKQPTAESTNCLARMKLATQEPLIQTRMPGLKCVAELQVPRQKYQDKKDFNLYNADGEVVTIKFLQKGKKVAEMTWKANFPEEIEKRHFTKFRPAEVKGQDLLKMLFRLPVFSQDDLKKIASSSSIPEVRIGALANIRN